MKSLPRPAEVWWLYLGVLSVVMVAATLRYAWIVYAQIDVNMPPSAAILTGPIFAAGFCVVAVVVDTIVRAFDRRSRPRRHYFVIGASYCSVMVFSLSMPLGVIVTLLVNPITARALIDTRQRAARGQTTS
jgi:hypothetical protein